MVKNRYGLPTCASAYASTRSIDPTVAPAGRLSRWPGTMRLLTVRLLARNSAVSETSWREAMTLERVARTHRVVAAAASWCRRRGATAATAGNGEALTRQDEAFDGEVVGAQQGGERDAVARGDGAQVVAGLDGIAPGARRRRAAPTAAAGGDGQALAGDDDAVDRQVVGGEQGAERDAVAPGDGVQGVSGLHRVGARSAAGRGAAARNGQSLARQDQVGDLEVIRPQQVAEPDAHPPGDAAERVAVAHHVGTGIGADRGGRNLEGEGGEDEGDDESGAGSHGLLSARPPTIWSGIGRFGCDTGHISLRFLLGRAHRGASRLRRWRRC